MEVRTVRASASLLPMLGVAPAMGRNFQREEDAAGKDGVALLADEGSLFRFDLLESQRGQNVSIIFDVLGRLKPGVTLEQAHAELTSLQARLPNFLPWHPRITIGMLPLRERLVGNAAATASLVLLGCTDSCCSSLAGMLTESGVLGVFACGAEIVLAWWLRGPMMRFSPYASGLEQLPFDGRVLGFNIGAGMLATISFGVLPAFRATGRHLGEAIRGGQIRYGNPGFEPHRAALSRLLAARGVLERLLERAHDLAGVQAAAITTAWEIPPGRGRATNVFQRLSGEFSPWRAGNGRSAGFNRLVRAISA